MSIEFDLYFTTTEDFCEFRPRGESSLIEVVELVSRAFTRCREQGIARLLVDATGVTGVPIPSLVDRFLMVEEWAQACEGLVVGAMVVEPQYIHPQKFGVKLARDLGLMLDVYPTEAEAMHWLSSVDVTSFGSPR